MQEAIAHAHADGQRPGRDDAAARAYVDVLVRERIRDVAEPDELIRLVSGMAAATGLHVADEIVTEAVVGAHQQKPPIAHESSPRVIAGDDEGASRDGYWVNSDDATPTWLSWLTASRGSGTVAESSGNSHVGSPPACLIAHDGAPRGRPAAPFHETDARLRALGVAGARERPAPCVLPGHEGHEAQVRQMPAGHFDYECRALSRPVGLAEVRAARAHGAVRRLTPAHAHVWRLRLDFESGLVCPPPVGLVLPEALPTSAVTLCEGIRLYVRLVTLSEEWPEELVLSRGFLVGWCGLTDEQVKRGRRLAERHGVIGKVGTKALPRGRANLYKPGDALVCDRRAA